MAKPEGYRKSQRIMKLASKLNIPLICFIDTSGAYPGKDAEERGQAEAIAQSMRVALNCEAPCISVIIGEGGSGGAIALGTSDRVLMLSNSIYSVISPEGCSSILWKSSEFAETASNSLKITAQNCLDLGIIDQIIEEDIGGAHRNHIKISTDLKLAIIKNLNDLNTSSLSTLVDKRNQRYLNYLP
jgi:acetyl-CoA carboxylase carboxyl transferase subunit alpha